MVNKNEEPNVLKTKTEQPKTAPTKRLNNNSLLTGLACGGALIAIVLSGYTLMINQQEHRNLTLQKNKLTTQIEAFNQDQLTIQKQLSEKTDAVETMRNEFKNKLTQLEQQINSSTNKSPNQNPTQAINWPLQKARYYLELAQINTFWTVDLNTSVALLQQADTLLKPYNETKIFAIRQAIANEIAQLKAIPALDITGLISKLAAAQSLVHHLAIQTPADDIQPKTQQEPAKTAPASAWRMHLQDSANALEKLVVIRRNDEEIKPLLSPLLASLLKESIHLDLQQAQWAVLNRNDTVYQFALKTALMNIKRSFNETEQRTQALIQQLNELQLIKLTQEKPGNGHALPLLNQLINQQDSGKK